MRDSIYKSYTWYKSSVQCIYKELSQLNTKKTTQLKNVQKISTDIPPKKINKWCRHTERYSTSSVPSCCLVTQVVSDSLWPHVLQHPRLPLSLTISWSFPKLLSTELVMLSNHLILCCPLLLLSSIFPSIRVFPNESPLQVVIVLELQIHHQSFQRIFRVDLL